MVLLTQMISTFIKHLYHRNAGSLSLIPKPLMHSHALFSDTNEQDNYVLKDLNMRKTLFTNTTYRLFNEGAKS